MQNKLLVTGILNLLSLYFIPCYKSPSGKLRKKRRHFIFVFLFIGVVPVDVEGPGGKDEEPAHDRQTRDRKHQARVVQVNHVLE